MNDDIRNILGYKLCQIQMYIKDVDQLVGEVKILINQHQLIPTIDPTAKEKDRDSRQNVRAPYIKLPEILPSESVINKAISDFEADNCRFFVPPDISFNEMKNLGDE